MRLALFIGGCVAAVYAIAYDRWVLLAGVIVIAAGVCLYDTVREGKAIIAAGERWARDEIEREASRPPLRRQAGGAASTQQRCSPRSSSVERSKRAHPSNDDGAA